MKTAHIFAAVLVTCLFIAACNSGDRAASQENTGRVKIEDSLLIPGSPKAIPSDTIHVSAINLVSDYVANEVKADYTYKGRILEVSGVVQDIKKGMGDDIFVILDGHRQFRAVQCYLYNNNEEVARNLSQGMKVNFTGECEGLMANVVLKNCVLIHDSK